jgi:hypothetical protein
MVYTLDQFAADCRAALLKDAGPAGRERVRQFTEKACADRDFIARHLGPDVDAERTIFFTRTPTFISAYSATSIRAPELALLTIMGRVGLSMGKPPVKQR